MKKFMNIWAKISSIIIIPLLIVLILFIPAVFTEGITKGTNALLIGAIIILFYLPLIYYAWFKKPNSKKMKLFAKITTGLTAILSIWIMIVDKDINVLVKALIFYTPVFYYAWKKDK